MAKLRPQYTFVQWLLDEEVICNRCRQQFAPLGCTLYLDTLRVYACYRYNDFLEQLLFQYKEGRDTALATVFFANDLVWMKKRFSHWHWTLLPSSHEKRIERGFFSVRDMLAQSGQILYEPFYKRRDYKQSAMGKQRSAIAEIIALKQEYPLPKGNILLIDDVCTSGATLLHAYRLLQGHTDKIEAVVLCAHPLLLAPKRSAASSALKGRRGKNGRYRKMVQ